MADFLLDDMEQDANEGVGVPVPGDEDFRTVSQLVDEQLELASQIEGLEEDLKDLKDQYRAIERGKLPAAIEKFGFASFKLLGGRGEVTVKDEVYAGITEERREAAFEWLASTGHDDIIKNTVTLNFGKGQDSETRQLMLLLNDRGYSYQNSRNVHPSTLKAFVRQQLESGAAIPADTFSIHVEKIAKIKLKK